MFCVEGSVRARDLTGARRERDDLVDNRRVLVDDSFSDSFLLCLPELSPLFSARPGLSLK